MKSSSQALVRARPKAKNEPAPKPKDPIRSVIVKGVQYWMVTLPKHGGGRNRRYFRSGGEAKTYLQEKRVELLNQGTASLAITDSQRVALLTAEELLAPYGKTIVDAAEFYVERHERIKNSRPVDDAITDFLVALKADGLSGATSQIVRTVWPASENRSDGGSSPTYPLARSATGCARSRMKAIYRSRR